MQTPVTVGIVGKNNCYKAAISSLLLAMTATSGCSSTPTTATPNPSLASGTATPQTSSEATHISEHPDTAKPAIQVSNSETKQTEGIEQTNSNASQVKSADTKEGHPTSATTAASNASLSVAENLEISKLKIEILSLRDKVDSLQRKFELVLRSQRAGIFQVESPELVQAAVDKAKTTHTAVPPLMSEGPLDPFDYETEKQIPTSTSEAPQSLVDRALIHLTQADYAKVLQLLEDFQNRFPNNPLSSTAALALTEAYVELQSPQRAIAHVRGFYLQHPNDLRMPNAKWFEAKIHEQLRAPQKAAQLYREVIALAPKSELALKARASLEKLAEGRVQ